MCDYLYGVVLIDYKSINRTTKYILDLLEVVSVLPKYIVVIDNCVEDKEYLEFLKYFNMVQYKLTTISEANECFCGKIKDVTLIYVKSFENLGFAKGNNLGVRILNSFNVNYCLISNSDIIFAKDFKIEKFCEALYRNKDVLGVGSDVFDINGRRQSPCGYLTIYDRWWRGKLLWPLLKNIYKEVDETISPNSELVVYRLIGAFFMIDINRFWRVDGFDSHTFLYGEELILSARATTNGLKMLYIPGLPVNHEDGLTVKKESKSNSQKMRLQLKSDLYYYNEYCGVNKMICLVTQVIVNSYLLKKGLLLKINSLFSK